LYGQRGAFISLKIPVHSGVPIPLSDIDSNPQHALPFAAVERQDLVRPQPVDA